MRDHAARTRVGLTAGPDTVRAGEDPRIHITRSGLRALEFQGRSLRLLPKQPAASVLNGRHASRFRGRGLNFEELREYLPGDDPRTIDWKVTARTGSPHVRVFTEERDRPVLLLVDQRISMFFGTRHNMKSVTAAEAAALIAFRVLDQGDRIGGIVFGDESVGELRPRKSRQALDQFLLALERANHALSADAPTVDPAMPLNQPLASALRIARRNHLVVIISDFDEIDVQTEKMIGTLSRHNDLILCPVTDPISRDIPEGFKLVVSDGNLQAELDTSSRQTDQSLRMFVSERLNKLLSWQRRFGLSVLPLDTGEDTLPQILRLTGHRGSIRKNQR
ncbi:DUF58 domain-containing protein [Labrenzia sp. OB1]|uniref:DUF58 domain-containing protein n=1 Tax=Labrenzia sp. OB1 TaxID=1561204 RepID=UPI0007B18F1E|nr:DUF58 domain-containing protein [Labrenzia sp. OB1]KZM49768.1 MoxR protein [Labrenzia sp. OB1]